MVRCIPEHGPLACGGIDGVGFEAALQVLAYEHDAQVQKLKLEVSKLMRACQSQVVSDSLALAQAAGIGPRALPRPPPAVLAAPLVSGTGRRATESLPQPDVGRKSLVLEAIEEDQVIKRATPRKTLKMIQTAVVQSKLFRTASSMSADGFEGDNSMIIVDACMSGLIMLNILLIGISADVAPQSVAWVVVDALFALAFLFEICLKIRVTGLLNFSCGPEKLMNWLEAVLVALAVSESIVTSVQMSLGASSGVHLLTLFRTLRVCRVIRIIRVVRLEVFKELKEMIRGTVGGMKTLAWSVVLIVLPVYTMCILLREALGDHTGGDSGAEYFASVPRSFFSVFRCIVIGDCAANDGRPLYVLITENHGWQYGVLYCVVAVFMSFGLYNVIVAMFVENVVKVSKERETMARKGRLRDPAFFGRKMAELLQIVYCVYTDLAPCPNGRSFSTVDSGSTGGSGRRKRRFSGSSIFALAADMELTPEMFAMIRELPDVQRILYELDVADDDQHNLFETLDADGGGTIDMEEFCSGIQKLRGDPCRSDIISIDFKIKSVQSELHACMETFGKRLQLQHELVEKMWSKLDGGGC
eukprot:TRINITY_DN10423_c0_g5_i1.p1 TRINITY_DN10423_c0_g5~~TRINITY_DN10423_c0_g5_i1.p1  ORF type:complete len:606 (-),score=77.71 TRINITY_DN10423_c0_g5_i1:276-2033(-)